MAEYIEREALRERFEKRLDWLRRDIHDEYSGALYDGCETDMGLIAEIPAADVAPVVRCRDCKYRDGTPGQPNILCAQMHEDDFCSYGERKEGKDG